MDSDVCLLGVGVDQTEFGGGLPEMFWRLVLEPEGRQLHTLPGLFALSISWRLFIQVLRIFYLMCSLFAQYSPSACK